MTSPQRRFGGFHPGLVYTASRLGIFLVVTALLFAVGFRSFVLVLVALVISAPLSFILLKRQRMAFAERVEGRVSKRSEEKARLRATLAGDDE
jgi:positive regulator of sigma E activity